MNKMLKITLCILLLAQASACTMDDPTWVNPSRVEVHEEGYSDTFYTDALDNPTLRAIGVNYYRYGNGPMDVAVSYDSSVANSAAEASRQGKRIEKELRRQGVDNIRLSASQSAGERSSTKISFPALTAKPPQDCGLMPGYEDAQTSLPENAEGPRPGYGIGCTIETLMAKQIARPGDLLGRPGFETDADARRQHAVIWQRGYYSNKSNPPLQGESASDTK
ncbi:MAG: hypothetical protein DI586_05315 [Micavibrio aeruginosavorus]|uniref:Lipoprotein n=1 Tax=Micavibrio aeruginosavorus TaxID=349221 RepID=A0A2W5FJ26_9BACT|nr:MAG: hypothetical protein DI586_05315 [Micavibrio aeruginosavorus]